MKKIYSSEEEHEIHNWVAQEKFVTEEHETLKKISREKFVSEEHEIIYMHLRSTSRSQQLPPPDSSTSIIFHFCRLDIFAESANPEFFKP